MATPTDSLKTQLQKDKIVDALAKAHPLPIQHCCQVLVDYHPHLTDDPPHITYTAPLRKGDFVHFKTRYNNNWWIGRVVGHETGMTFVPSEGKLSAVIRESGDGGEEVLVYKRAPVMRPIVLLGPSRKDSQLTTLLHKPLINYISVKFVGRLQTIKPDWSVNRDMSEKHINLLESDVFTAASSAANIILLDCDASYPGDFDNTDLYPQFVYIKIARQKVLQTILKQLTSDSRDRQSQLEDARHLFENSSKCSLTISESNIDDACLSIELFLESYWAATRSVVSLLT